MVSGVSVSTCHDPGREVRCSLIMKNDELKGAEYTENWDSLQGKVLSLARRACEGIASLLYVDLTQSWLWEWVAASGNNLQNGTDVGSGRSSHRVRLFDHRRTFAGDSDDSENVWNLSQSPSRLVTWLLFPTHSARTRVIPNLPLKCTELHPRVLVIWVCCIQNPRVSVAGFITLWHSLQFWHTQAICRSATLAALPDSFWRPLSSFSAMTDISHI